MTLDHEIDQNVAAGTTSTANPVAETPRGLPSGWTVDQANSPAELDPEEWDRLVVDAGGGFYLSRGWLSAIHGVDGFTERTKLVRDERGKLVAALGLYTIEQCTNPLYDPHAVLAPDTDPDDWKPQLVIGGRSGYTNGILATTDQGYAAVAALAAEAVQESGCGSAAIMYLERDHARRISALLPGTTPVLTGFRARIPVTFDDWDGYLASMSNGRKWEARRELRKFEAAGCRIEVTELSPYVEPLGRLLGNVQRHHGVDIPDELHIGYLRGCAKGALAEQAVVFQCFRGEDLIGFALGFRHRGQLAMRVAGLDYEKTRGTNAYFVLMSYQPVRYALEHGLTTIDLGPEGYRTKLLRGGELVPLYAVPVRTPEVWGAELAAAHNERVAQEWES
ncbi:MAG: GNAT family N-acetyltransferase, partial [Micromonosporaceae bacterium]